MYYTGSVYQPLQSNQAREIISSYKIKDTKYTVRKSKLIPSTIANIKTKVSAVSIIYSKYYDKIFEISFCLFLDHRISILFEISS